MQYNSPKNPYEMTPSPLEIRSVHTCGPHTFFISFYSPDAHE